jgi:hypothetical protein
MRMLQTCSHSHKNQTQGTWDTSILASLRSQSLWIWGTRMKFTSICRLDKAAGYGNHMVKDTIQTWPHPSDFNRNVSFMISWTWQPLICPTETETWHSSFWILPTKSSGLWPTASPTLCWYNGRAGCESRHIKTLIIEVESVLKKLVYRPPGIAISLIKFYWILLLYEIQDMSNKTDDVHVT